MKCPVCNEKTEVIDTRYRKGNQWRRRECLICSFRFSSYELLDERLNELLDYERLFYKFQDVVEKYK